MTLKNFLELGSKHTLHSSLDLIDDLIDDTVSSDINAVSLCGVKSVFIGTHVEANDDRAGSSREHNVALGDTADCRVNNGYLDLVV